MSKKKKITLSIVVVVVAILCLWEGVREIQYTKAYDEYDKALEVYQEHVKVMDYACDKEGYIDTIKVNTQLLHDNEGGKFESRMYYYTLIIYLNDKITELSDEEKCLTLTRFKYAAGDEMKRVREECGYEKCIEAIKNDKTDYDIYYRGRNIRFCRSIDIKFYNEKESYKLGSGKFEVCTYEDDYATRKYGFLYSWSDDRLLKFELEPANREKVTGSKPKTTTGASPSSSVTKKKSSNSSTTRKSSSSKSKKVYNDGPRDIDDVDIDSFYEDNRDEFEDFDDAWDYMENNPEEWDDY